MSQTPTLPKPAPETKRALGGPIHLSRTLQALFVSAVAGLPVLVQQVRLIPDLVFPTWVNHLLMVVSIAALWLSPLLARAAGISAAASVADGALPAPPESPSG